MARCLGILLSLGPQSLNALAELAALPQSTTSRLVGRMEELGLVMRERQNHDSRSVRIDLLPAGRAAWNTPLALAHEKRIIAGLSDAEAKELRRLLTLIYEPSEESVVSQQKKESSFCEQSRDQRS